MSSVNPFFEVYKEPLYTKSGIPVNKVALINAETNSVIGVASPNYEIVPNKKIAELFENAFDKVVSVEDHLDARTSRWCRHIVLDTDEYAIEITKGDIVRVMLKIFNSYNAKAAFGFSVSAIRLACLNGMTVIDPAVLSVKYYHFHNNANAIKIDFSDVVVNLSDSIKKWKQWTKVEYSRDNFKEFVEKLPYISDKMTDYLLNNYDVYKSKFRGNDTKWTAYNAITYAMTHNTAARRGSHIFSNRFNTLNKVTHDFYKSDVIEV